MRKTQIDKMVDRFLCWKLPEDFGPDCGISFDGRQDDELGKNKTWPTGTNLFTATQAKHMLSEVVGTDEELLSLVEKTANMLRGMTLDPGVPVHTKYSMRSRIAELEAAVESRIDG